MEYSAPNLSPQPVPPSNMVIGPVQGPGLPPGRNFLQKVRDAVWPSGISRRRKLVLIGGAAVVLVLILVVLVLLFWHHRHSPVPATGKSPHVATGQTTPGTKKDTPDTTLKPPVATPNAPKPGGAPAPGSGGSGGTTGGNSGGGTTGGGGGTSNWPGPSNTGVPVGVVLTNYTDIDADGNCTITDPGVVIDAKVMNCSVRIETSGVKITRTKIIGSITDDEDPTHSFTLTDSEVDAGSAQNAAVWHTHFTVLRSNVHGGQTAVSCVEACVVKDSWLHGQVISVKGQHLGGFLSNGGGSASAPSLIQHNTIVCDSPQMYSGSDTASCGGDTNLYGDFAPVSYYTFDNNLFQAEINGSFCVYGGSATGGAKPYPDADHIVYTNNVFERGTNNLCGYYGPVSNFDAARPGNVWSNNKWDDGTILSP